MFAIFSLFLLLLIIKKCSDLERKQLKINFYTCRSRSLRRKIRLVFLSDLHEAEFGEGNKELLDRISELSPALVLIGGDSIISRKYRRSRRDNSDSVDRTCALLNKLKKRYKVAYAMGNHETRMLEKAGLREPYPEELPEQVKEESLAAAGRFFSAAEGIRLLDSSEYSPEDYPELIISGVTLPREYYKRLLFRKKKELTAFDYIRYSGKSPEVSGEGKFRIALLHSPLYHKEAIENGEELVLSGHFHGGTIRIPYLGGLMSPQLQFFVKESAGEFLYKNGRMLVSRGLGTHSVNLRINNFPELTVIDLMPEQEKTDR